MSFLKSRIKSFGYAFSGLLAFFKTEVNGQIHLCAAIVVTIAGWWFKIEGWQWCAQLLCIAIVIGLEMMNTAIEKTINYQTDKIDPRLKYIKDVSAAAVLVSAIISIIVAAIIYLPHFDCWQ